jgi:HpcH/HpaI aldolase/citrate lyase family
MLELLQITNDPVLAAQCDAMDGMRIFVDLERNGKQERQAGRNTFLSTHQMADIAPIAVVLKRARLMVRLNPVFAGSGAEIDESIAAGAQMLMLPMFRGKADLAAFCALVDGRVPVVALLENADALHSIKDWIATPGLAEVFMGLNDLHISLGMRFMFEPLARGLVDSVAATVHQQGLRFGFGGIARVDQGQINGATVLGEHLRLGSQAVILSRSFHSDAETSNFAQDIAALRRMEQVLLLRDTGHIEADRLNTMADIDAVARQMGGNT